MITEATKKFDGEFLQTTDVYDAREAISKLRSIIVIEVKDQDVEVSEALDVLEQILNKYLKVNLFD